MRFKLVLIIFATVSIRAIAAEDSSGGCQQAYARLYAKPEIKMSLFIGYLDEGDLTQDGMVKADLVDGLVRPCSGGHQFCGFTRDPDNADFFYKNIKGPDGNERRVRLQVTNSSISSETGRNTGELATQQRSKSANAISQFKQSLSSNEVVLYQGHAGLGFGPIFGPNFEPKLTVDEMTKFVRGLNTKPIVMGMIVCKGEQNYGNKLHAAAPGTALVLTRQTTAIEDGLATVRATFDSLLSMKCGNQFKNAFRDATQTLSYGFFEPQGKETVGEKIPRISGFFEPITRDFPNAPSGMRQYIEYLMERKIDAPESHPSGTAK